MMVDILSRPPRARGLKLFVYRFAHTPKQVAPRVGAWIETDALMNGKIVVTGRAPRGRVD